MGTSRSSASTWRSWAPFGIALILAIAGFNHGFSYLFTTQGVQHAATNPLGLDFHGNWLLGAP